MTRKFTKKQITAVLEWSTSRYNEYSKKDVVDVAYRVLNRIPNKAMWNINNHNLTAIERCQLVEVCDLQVAFTTGSYTEKFGGGGFAYTVDAASQTITKRGYTSEVVLQ